MVQDNQPLAGLAAGAATLAEATKPWWLSKTIIGAGIGAAGMATAYAGVQLDGETQRLLIDQAYAFTAAGLALVSTVTVIVGRIMATKAIGKVKA